MSTYIDRLGNGIVEPLLGLDGHNMEDDEDGQVDGVPVPGFIVGHHVLEQREDGRAEGHEEAEDDVFDLGGDQLRTGYLPVG